MHAEKKVKDAFYLIKTDISLLVKWIDYFHGQMHEMSELVQEMRAQQEEFYAWKEMMEKRFNECSMNNAVKKLELHQQVSEASLPLPQRALPGIDSLTEQQKKTLFLVGSLQREQGTYVPVRQVNAELYGEENVGHMQTTVANFLKKLEEMCLIERMRKGRQSLVRLSETGVQVLAHHHAHQLTGSVMPH